MKVSRKVEFDRVDSVSCYRWGSSLEFRSGNTQISIELTQRQLVSLHKEITEQMKHQAKEALEKAQEFLADTDKE